MAGFSIATDPLPLPGGADVTVPMAGAYVGDGMPQVPAKLAAKIRRWEFVEMGELLPEFWAGPKEEEQSKECRVRQGRKVTDICTWVQCFGTYAAVLVPAEPLVVPELIAYMGITVRVSQDYEGLGWVWYNSAFRRPAALSGNRKWSVMNGTLFTMNFSGRAAGTKRRELCFATSHNEREICPKGRPRTRHGRTAAQPGVSCHRYGQAAAPSVRYSATASLRRVLQEVECNRLHLSKLQASARTQQLWQ